jgi:hypothetical protein
MQLQKEYTGGSTTSSCVAFFEVNKNYCDVARRCSVELVLSSGDGTIIHRNSQDFLSHLPSTHQRNGKRNYFRSDMKKDYLVGTIVYDYESGQMSLKYAANDLTEHYQFNQNVLNLSFSPPLFLWMSFPRSFYCVRLNALPLVASRTLSPSYFLPYSQVSERIDLFCWTIFAFFWFGVRRMFLEGSHATHAYSFS